MSDLIQVAKNLRPIIDDVYKGVDVSQQYSALSSTEQLVMCMVVCARLSSILDSDQYKDQKAGGTELSKNAPQEILYVGNFLNEVSFENMLTSVSKQITVNRLIKFNIDEREYWNSFIPKASDLVEKGELTKIDVSDHPDWRAFVDETYV